MPACVAFGSLARVWIAYGVPIMDLARIRDCLGGHRPQLLPTAGMRLAGVSMVLRDDLGELEVLLIERATRVGDPWSGDMAFPGGRAEPRDPTLKRTAERETREEVGVGLERADWIGRLDDLSGRAAASSRMVVSAYVYYLQSCGELVLDRSEVADAIWVPLRRLVHPENLVRHPMRYGEHEVVFPGIRMEGGDARVVWGLTYRFLDIFFEIIGHSLPDHGIPDPEIQAQNVG